MMKSSTGMMSAASGLVVRELVQTVIVFLDPPLTDVRRAEDCSCDGHLFICNYCSIFAWYFTRYEIQRLK